VGDAPENHRRYSAPAGMMNWTQGQSRLDRVLLVLYYFAIVVVLIVMYGRGDFSTSPFVYQGF